MSWNFFLQVTPRLLQTLGTFLFCLSFFGLETSLVTTHRASMSASAYAIRKGSLPIASISWSSNLERSPRW